ncbi:hypothetical protein BH23VER1_BH23VER1_10100 [soil metagenome]
MASPPPVQPPPIPGPAHQPLPQPLPLPSDPPLARPAESATATASPAPGPTGARESLEMELGMVWLVRIGVVMVLTALVFGTRLAYAHYIVDLPAGGKAALWYVLSALLGGAGLWLERRFENLKRYAGVLIGGGLAAVYYTTYAIHHVERLRIVESPLLGGVLLFGCALGILVFAARRRSNTIAIVAVTMAYYASVISPIGWFALFSNLLLTGTGIAFFLRYRWASLGWVCLAATYGAFWFWQFVYAGAIGAPPVAFGVLVAFLSGYWLLFTAAVFVPRADALADPARTLLAQLNNALYFLLGTLLVLDHDRDGFWIFALVLGAVLILLSQLPVRREIRHLHDAYLASGIALAIVGAVAKLDGYQLVLTLALSSALLQVASMRAGGVATRMILTIGTFVVSGLAVFVSFEEWLGTWQPVPLFVGLVHGFVALGQAHLAERCGRSGGRWAPGAHTVLALAAWGAGALAHAEGPWLPLTALGAACVFAALSGWRAARLPHLGVAGLAYAAIGILSFLSRPNPSDGETLPLSLALGTGFLLILVWQFFAKSAAQQGHDKWALNFLVLGWIAMVGRFTERLLPSHEHWQWAGGALALALFAAGALAGTWRLAAAGQLFLLWASYDFLGRSPNESALLGSVPIVALIVSSVLVSLALRHGAPVFLRGADRGGIEEARAAGGVIFYLDQILAAILVVVFAIRHFPDSASLLIGVVALAVIGVGMIAGLRLTRRLGLGLLAVALVRVIVTDVWHLPAVPRFLTFLVIGIVLLALGFLYNRYEEKVRRYI